MDAACYECYCNAAEASMKALVTQAKVTTSRLNSLPIDGRAMLMEELMTGTMKEAMVIVRRTAFSLVGFLVRFIL